ncbi:hypothetical protein P692DRAFT_201876123, partial [Suillus brevipes Sb2]
GSSVLSKRHLKSLGWPFWCGTHPQVPAIRPYNIFTTECLILCSDVETPFASGTVYSFSPLLLAIMSHFLVQSSRRQ